MYIHAGEWYYVYMMMNDKIYMVVERNLDEPESYGTPAKLFTDEAAAERWASIQEDQADLEHHMGRTHIRYSYVVEPWVVHDSV